MYPGHWASFPGCSWADSALQRWYLHGSEFKYPISSILSERKNLMGSVVFLLWLSVTLFPCNSPGAPGAADVLCAGDWASDWSCLHHSPRRSCPTRTQGASLIIYPFIPCGFGKKKSILSVFCLAIQSFLTALLNSFCYRWPSWPVTSIHSLWHQWAWPPSSWTTSSKWPSWTRPRPCRSRPCRCSMLPRKAGEIQRYQAVHNIISVCFAYHDCHFIEWSG